MIKKTGAERINCSCKLNGSSFGGDFGFMKGYLIDEINVNTYRASYALFWLVYVFFGVHLPLKIYTMSRTALLNSIRVVRPFTC